MGASSRAGHMAKARLMMDAIRINRTDGALVRIIVPITDQAVGATPDQSAAEFVSALFPLLDRHLPILIHRYEHSLVSHAELPVHQRTGFDSWLRLDRFVCWRSTGITSQVYQRGDAYLGKASLPKQLSNIATPCITTKPRADAHFKLGQAYARSDQPAKAIREYVRAADLLPENDDIQLKAGTALLVIGRFAEARSRAEKVLQRAPRHVQALLFALANSLAGLKDLDRAIAEVEEAVTVDPTATQPYTNLGALHLVRGEPRGRRKALRKALEADARDAGVTVLGNFFWSGGRLAEAEGAFKTAWALDPNDLRAGTSDGAPPLYLGTPCRCATVSRKGRGTFIGGRAQTGAGRTTMPPWATERGGKGLTTAHRRSHSDGYADLRFDAIDFAAGNKEQAYARLDQILQRDKTHLAAQLQKANWLARDRKFDAALDGKRRPQQTSEVRGCVYIVAVCLSTAATKLGPVTPLRRCSS